MRQPLLTFGVVARIHWQALRLVIERVPFYGKQPPPARSAAAHPACLAAGASAGRAAHSSSIEEIQP
jgi:DUF1365 family protein